MAAFVLFPGAVSAQTDIDLPVALNSVNKVVVADVGQYTSGSDVAPVDQTIVSSAPAAGEVWLNSDTTIQLGDATTVNKLVIVEGEQLGSDPLPS